MDPIHDSIPYQIRLGGDNTPNDNASSDHTYETIDHYYRDDADEAYLDRNWNRNASTTEVLAVVRQCSTINARIGCFFSAINNGEAWLLLLD